MVGKQSDRLFFFYWNKGWEELKTHNFFGTDVSQEKLLIIEISQEKSNLIEIAPEKARSNGDFSGKQHNIIDRNNIRDFSGKPTFNRDLFRKRKW